jgi:hypothetical protein
MTKFPSTAKRVQHVKRGNTYQIIGQTVAEKEMKEGDKAPLKAGGMRMRRSDAPIYMEIQCSLRDIHVSDIIVIYRCEQTQKYWGRLLDDFNSPGRFAILEA